MPNYSSGTKREHVEIYSLRPLKDKDKTHTKVTENHMGIIVATNTVISIQLSTNVVRHIFHCNMRNMVHEHNGKQLNNSQDSLNRHIGGRK